MDERGVTVTRLTKPFLATIMVFMLTLSTFLPQASANALQQYAEKTVAPGSTSVTVESVRTGYRVLSIKGDIPRLPASNLKLVTGFSALGILGEDFRFKTEVYTNGQVQNGVLKGHLFIKGYGNPTLQYNDLVTIGKALKAKGIHKIDGHILGDDSYFSGSQVSPGVIPSEESNYYAARVSALTMAPNKDYDAGSIIVTVKPSKVGSKANVTQEPGTSDMKVVNKSTTSKKGTRNTISIKRQSGTNNLVISGQIPIGSSKREWVTVLDPTITTLHYARTAFKKAGIELGQGSWYWRQSIKPEYTLLYTHQSQTLKSMYPTFMKLSNNVMADAFLKTIGAETTGVGDLVNGEAAIRAYFKEQNVPLKNFTMVDGSGFSIKNRLTTNEVARFLNVSRSFSTFNTFYAGLPVGGVSNRLVGGSLSSRFQGSYAKRVVAKTGYIDGVYALSGYVKTKQGNEYIVSIMSNGNTSSKIGKIDQFVKHLIDHY